ncbi:hypothetical protein OH77DRAFT_25099 [Trametes cingulata]|nr:hypothetical protein OH77DRAFT_25099 [Trametes cingulata]
MQQTSYATAEPHALLWFEQSINAAVYIGAVSYGIHIAVFSITMYFLFRPRQHHWPAAAFVAALFAMGTINIVCNINFNELAWIDDRNYPGGPLSFMQEQQALPVDTVGNSAAIVASFLADGFLLYRCYLLWSHMPSLLVIPVLAYIASIVLSVFTVVAAARPTSSLWAATTLKVALPYWALTMSLNATLSVLLISRLAWLRGKVDAALGADHARVYTSVLAITIESALLYGIVSFIFVVLYGLQNTAENLFIPLLVQVECIAPELIMLRVARGTAWSKDTVAQTRVDLDAGGSETVVGNSPPSMEEKETPVV